MCARAPEENARVTAEKTARRSDFDLQSRASGSERKAHPATTTTEELAPWVFLLWTRCGLRLHFGVVAVTVAGTVALTILVALLGDTWADGPLEHEKCDSTPYRTFRNAVVWLAVWITV